MAANRISTFTIASTVQQAVRQRVWLERMQKQIQTTASALKTNPSAIISLFQKTLSRPSYFLARSGSGQWTLLLGPKPRIALPDSPVPHPDEQTGPIKLRVFDFVLPEPPLYIRAGRRSLRLSHVLLKSCWNSARALHQWLMHPVIDTREPSEPA
jgi:hypothetical protein